MLSFSLVTYPTIWTNINFQTSANHSTIMHRIRPRIRLLSPLRSFSAVQQNPNDVFNRPMKLVQRERGALSSKADEVEYLRDEVARKTIERLSFIKKDLPTVLDLGSGKGNFAKLLSTGDDEDCLSISDKIKEITMIDSSSKILYSWSDLPFNDQFTINRIAANEEKLSQVIPANSQDCVISNLSMHWLNDLPSTLDQIQTSLKPNGVFLGSIFCEDTLFELRTSLQIAEMERKGRLAPGRVSPLVRVNDMTALLKKAGLEMVTIDVEEITVSYPDILTIMEDLQLMGEQNANLLNDGNIAGLSMELILAADAVYKALHGEKSYGGVSLPLTFRVLFMIGWKPEVHSLSKKGTV